MAKTIKFNLICDGNPVRTLDDLRNNFSIEDIVDYFNSGFLQRWLSVRGYGEEYDAIEKLNKQDSLEVIKKLVDIFKVEADSTVIDKNTYIFKYENDRKILLEEYKNADFRLSEILDDYHKGYDELINTIIENKDDMAKIKSAVEEIDKRYKKLYDMDYRKLFYNLLKNAPMGVFVMLMNENMRKKYLPLVTKDEDGNEKSDIDIGSETYNEDKNRMYYEISEMINDKNVLKKILGNNLKMFSGVTDDYWKDVEPKGKKHMVLFMHNGNFVRSSGVSGGDLDANDVNYHFKILDGIDYKSNNASRILHYMEV